MGRPETDNNSTSLLEENLKKALTELLVLFLLAEKDRYIGELTTALNERSNGILTIVFPYSAIYRLLQSGDIIESEKKTAPDGRRRQYLAVTPKGRDRLAQLMGSYERFMKGVADVLKTGGEAK